MINFKEFQLLSEAKVNSHMQHIADLVFLEGVTGTRKAINFLRDVRDMLKNDGAKSRSNITVKWDGAPAVICGIDPTDGKFFVAKKGIFNKNPKVYKTQADIDTDLSGELHTKFSILLPELKKLGIKGILQGDLMYTHDDLKTTEIDGKTYFTFHPNTIMYAVPQESDLGKQISAAKVGIVFHTKYTGNDFASLEASFGEALTTNLKKVKSVWAVDAMYEDQTGKANFTVVESEYVTSKLSHIGKLFNSVSAEIINHIQKDQEIQDLVMIYINSRVRANKGVESGIRIAGGFMQFVHDRYQKEIDTKKSDKGKQVSSDKRIRALTYLNSVSAANLGVVFDLAYEIDAVKNKIVEVLNRASKINTFLKTQDGFRITNPEGFVAINSTGDAIKLVDRMVFSQANFSADVLKGWQR